MDLSKFFVANDVYVKVYGTEHVLYLIFCFLLISCVLYSHKTIAQNKNDIFKLCFYISLFQQVFLLYGWHAVFASFDLTISLPLHICRVANILSLIFLYTQNIKWLDTIFYFSLFVFGSLFYPLNVYSFTHINGISYMINHILTVLIPILGVICCNWRPSWKGCKVAMLSFSVYFPIVYFINPILGEDANYFYLIDRPFLNNLSYQAYAAFTYFGTMAAMCLVTFLLVDVLNFAIKKYNKKETEKQALEVA